jgi:hypothetical protein
MTATSATAGCCRRGGLGLVRLRVVADALVFGRPEGQQPAFAGRQFPAVVTGDQHLERGLDAPDRT